MKAEEFSVFEILMTVNSQLSYIEYHIAEEWLIERIDKHSGVSYNSNCL